MEAIEPGVECLDPIEADRQPYHQRHGDAETEAHLIARKDRRMQGHAVRNQRDQQEKALARRHALLTLRNRCAGEDATAPEHDAEAGIKRGWNQMK